MTEDEQCIYSEVMADKEEEPYLYQLVQFESKKKRGEPEIDFVPSTWVEFNPTKGRCECKYMPPPYTDEDSELLQDLIKQLAKPPESWPSYPITFRGHAKDHSEALERIKLLKKARFAYTTEDGILPAEKASNTIQKFMKKKTKCDKSKTKDLMKVSGIRTSNDDHNLNDAESSSAASDKKSSSESSSESSDKNRGLKKRNVKRNNKKQIQSMHKNHKIADKRSKRQKNKYKTMENISDLSSDIDEQRNGIIVESKMKNGENKNNRKQNIPDTSVFADTDENHNINHNKSKMKNSESTETSNKIDQNPTRGRTKNIAVGNMYEDFPSHHKDHLEETSANSGVKMQKAPPISRISHSRCSTLTREVPPEPSLSPKSDKHINAPLGSNVLTMSKPPDKESLQRFQNLNLIEESQSRHKEAPIDKTPQKQSIWSAMQDMKFEIQQQTKAIKELKGVVENSALAQNVYGSKVKSFASQHNLSLPLTHIEDFNEFDLKLQQSKTFREEFTSTLHFLVDTETTLSKNITAVMKKHLARDVALQFTAVKASVGKSIFKETIFCRCLLDVILERYKQGGQVADIKEKTFYIELGHVLCNAIDWDGQRKQRKKKVPQPASMESVEK